MAKEVVLGARADARNVYWAAVSGTSEEPVLEADDRLRLPKDVPLPQQLCLLRKQLLAVIQKYEPKRAAIRCQETFLPRKPPPKALSSMLDRARIEGVFMETCAERGIRVWAGGLQAMKSELGASHSVKEYLAAPDLRGIDWSAKKSEVREAVVAALALIEEEADEDRVVV